MTSTSYPRYKIWRGERRRNLLTEKYPSATRIRAKTAENARNWIPTGSSVTVLPRTVVLFVLTWRKLLVNTGVTLNIIYALTRLCEWTFSEHKAAAFNGHSYVQLKKLKAYHRFSLEMEFKSFSDDGILLYDQQQPDGSGDFISIAIVNK